MTSWYNSFLFTWNPLWAIFRLELKSVPFSTGCCLLASHTRLSWLEIHSRLFSLEINIAGCIRLKSTARCFHLKSAAGRLHLKCSASYFHWQFTESSCHFEFTASSLQWRTTWLDRLSLFVFSCTGWNWYQYAGARKLDRVIRCDIDMIEINNTLDLTVLQKGEWAIKSLYISC